MENFEFADKMEYETIAKLLEKSNLPFSDIRESKVDFIITKESDQIVGCIGLEKFGTEGLLRSFAVDPNFRSKGYGKELCNRLLSYAVQSGVKRLHLLTTTAKDYFLKTGFSVQKRNEAPEVIQKSKEFSSLCPSSSVYMTLDI